MNTPSHIIHDLQKRANSNALRILSSNEGLDFCSNDFLGLAHQHTLIQRISDKLQNSKQLGSKGSRLLAGNSPFHTALEDELKSIFNAETTLLFNSGYSANLSLLSSIAKKNDTILYDEKAHASIKDGARLSLAKKLSFKHNQALDLDKKLKLAQGEKFVVVEAIYSMDGDFCSIEQILSICQKHNAFLIVDEAHSTAIYGKNASGWIASKNIEKEIFARIFTFGKAVGQSGACIAGSANLKNYLINFARPFIYTTSLPIYNIIAIQESIRFIIENPDLVDQLHENISLFKSIYSTLSDTAIQPIFIKGNDNLKAKAEMLQKQKFDVKPILSPTVQLGEERLRICLHNFNSKEDIKRLAQLL